MLRQPHQHGPRWGWRSIVSRAGPGTTDYAAVVPGPVVLLFRRAVPRLLAVVLLLVGLVSMHAVAHAAGDHAADHAADHAPGTTSSATVLATTTTGLPPAPSPEPCHDGGGSEAQCSSTATQIAVAQEAVAPPPGSLLLPLTALPQWPAPRAAAFHPPSPVSLRVILRT